MVYTYMGDNDLIALGGEQNVYSRGKFEFEL